MSALDVLIVGGGMYVTGRGTETPGTIAPALLEARRAGGVGRRAVVTTNVDTAKRAQDVIQQLGGRMDVDGTCDAFPQAGQNASAYATAADSFKPDVAIVVVPDHLHADVCETLCAKGIHCLVVKPMAPDTASAKRMINAAQENAVFGMVEFHKRLDDANVLLRNAVQSGELGTPLYAVVEYSQQKRIPRDVFKGWAAQTSIFQYLGVHYVDLLQFVTGYRPRRVTAWGQKKYLVEHGVDTWDAMQVAVEWHGADDVNFVSTHITNWIDPDESSAISDQKINVVGTAGRFQSDQKNRGVQVVRDGVGVRDVNPYFSACFEDRQSGTLRFDGYGIRSVRSFLDDVSALLNGNAALDDLLASRPSFQACLYSTAVVEAAHKSLLMDNTSVEVEL